MTIATIDDALHAPCALPADAVARFRRDGYVKLNGVLDPDMLVHYAPVLAPLVEKRRAKSPPMEERSTYAKAFVQVTNLWQRSEQAKEFVFSQRVARMAAELMEVRGVRLFHDQALYKEPHGGKTPWHADQFYWPLASDRSITAWIPLQDVPLEMGPLSFSPGSHRLQIGRDLAISDESEAKMKEILSGMPLAEEPFRLGDVSFHAGWTFHRAGGNNTDQMRAAMTMIYMDVDMKLAEPANAAQELDRAIWCQGAEVGGVIDGPLNPVLWSKTSS